MTNSPIIEERKQLLQSFIERWSLEALNKMTLQDYNAVGNTDSFCYWVEHVTDDLGRIRGSFSSKFGIWQMDIVKTGTSIDYTHDGIYKWRKKFGVNAKDAFKKVKEQVIEIATYAQNQEFDKIDSIDYFSLAKWKIAFLYSGNKLFPVYTNQSIRKIAKNFDFPNFKNARLSTIHQYLVNQTPIDEDLFEFAFRQYHLTKKETIHNYYIIGSKYRNDSGEYIDISQSLYDREVISTGFFWNDDLSHLFGKPKSEIRKWLDRNFSKREDYSTARNAHLHFLNIKEGDIIAVKSHGMGGDLTIIAYAEVVSKNDEIYFHDTTGELGHCIHVNFLETNLKIKTGLTYGQTVHQIIPYSKKGHFEKIFGGYSTIEIEENELTLEEEYFELSESRINEKQTESRTRNVSYSTTVRNVHNKIQSAFAKHLQKTYPNDIIQTERNYIDIVRQSDSALFYYEVKPYSTAYNCIRAAMGQLLDYYHSNPNKKREIHLLVVGSARIKKSDKKFIEFIKENFSISFDYICFKY